MAGTVRKTRGERREQALAAAREEFARAGMQGSVDLVAERAGVTASYLLRLFGTKKALFIAVVQRAFEHTLSEYERATKGTNGSEALEAVAATRGRLGNDERVTMMIQLQAFAACDDEEVREATSAGYGRIVEFVHAASDASPNELARFLGDVTHHRILAAMHMTTGPDRPEWARLLEEVGRMNARPSASFIGITNPTQIGR
jgi:AcrR family transcriptional regulator